ncbi:MAG: hypothetical protein R3A52_32850 [Polyangiales bacterium]
MAASPRAACTSDVTSWLPGLRDTARRIPRRWSDIGHGGIADVNSDDYPDRVAYARSNTAPSAVFAWYGGPSGLSPRVQRVTP